MPVVSSTSGEVTVVRHADDLPSRSSEYWPINWSAIWVGALTALALALIISLTGAAVGTHQLGPAGKIAKWSDIGFGALVFAVVGAFSSFAAGGWLAGRLIAFGGPETARLHGQTCWLVSCR